MTNDRNIKQGRTKYCRQGDYLIKAPRSLYAFN